MDQAYLHSGYFPLFFYYKILGKFKERRPCEIGGGVWRPSISKGGRVMTSSYSFCPHTLPQDPSPLSLRAPTFTPGLTWKNTFLCSIQLD